MKNKLTYLLSNKSLQAILILLVAFYLCGLLEKL